VNRALLALALIGLPPLLRSLGACAWRDVGLVQPSGQWRKLSSGFALGFASLACLAVAALAAGARALNPDLSAGRLVGKALASALTAAVVAVLEEILFRGAIFGALRKTWPWPSAMAVSSAIYAIVHFFSQPRSPYELHWSSVLVLLPSMPPGLADV